MLSRLCPPISNAATDQRASSFGFLFVASSASAWRHNDADVHLMCLAQDRDRYGCPASSGVHFYDLAFQLQQGAGCDHGLAVDALTLRHAEVSAAWGKQANYFHLLVRHRLRPVCAQQADHAGAGC